jgi:hypothetical protein
VSAFGTTVFLGIVCGIKREVAFASNDVQIFFEKDHGRAAEVCECRDENRLAARAERGESGTGDQLLNLEAGDGVERVCTAIGFLPHRFIMMVAVSRMTVLSGNNAEKYPEFLACGKEVYVLWFMLAVSVAISAEKNVLPGNSFCGKRIINRRRNFVDFKQNFSTVLSEMK